MEGPASAQDIAAMIDGATASVKVILYRLARAGKVTNNKGRFSATVVEAQPGTDWPAVAPAIQAFAQRLRGRVESANPS